MFSSSCFLWTLQLLHIVSGACGMQTGLQCSKPSLLGVVIRKLSLVCLLAAFQISFTYFVLQYCLLQTTVTIL